MTLVAEAVRFDSVILMYIVRCSGSSFNFLEFVVLNFHVCSPLFAITVIDLIPFFLLIAGHGSAFAAVRSRATIQCATRTQQQSAMWQPAVYAAVRFGAAQRKLGQSPARSGHNCFVDIHSVHHQQSANANRDSGNQTSSHADSARC